MQYTAFLCSHTSQLTHTKLVDMHPAFYKFVADNCPNLRCNVVINPVNASSLEKMAALGRCLKSVLLSAYDQDDELTVTDWQTVSLLCSQLETIELDIPSADALKAVQRLLSGSKPLLMRLRLSIWGPIGADFNEVFLKLSEYAGTLREFHFFGDPPEKGAFEAIAGSAPMLESVDLCLRNRTVYEERDRFDEHVEATIAAFLRCPNLRHLELSEKDDEEDIEEERECNANLCFRLHLKRMHSLYVKVLGIEYLV